MDKIYFKLYNGDVVDNYQLRKCFYLINNKDSKDDCKFFGHDNEFDLIRAFAFTLHAVECEIEVTDETIRELVKNNYRVTAVKLYHDLHPDLGLREAKAIIDRIHEEVIMDEKGKV